MLEITKKQNNPVWKCRAWGGEWTDLSQEKKKTKKKQKTKTGVANKHTESLASSLVMRQMQNCAQWDDIVHQFNWKKFLSWTISSTRENVNQ